MSYRDALDQRLAARGLSVHPYIELGSASLLCQMVERGMGVLLPARVHRPSLPSPPGVSPASMSPTALSPCTGSCSITKDKWLTPQMKAFIELVKQ
mgnify:CR=1 FL=1